MAVTYYNNYTPVGDVLVLAIILVFVILIRTAFISKTKNFLIFKRMLALLVFAAITDMLFHITLNLLGTVPPAIPLLFRFLYHACLYGNLFLYVLYMKEPLQLDRRADYTFHMIGVFGLIFFIAIDILSTVFRFGFYIDAKNEIHKGLNLFPLGYIFFVVLLFAILIMHRTRVYQKVVIGILFTCLVSVLIMFVQGIYGQSSYTVASFLFPAFAILYLIHSNPYDIELGTVNADAFEDMVAYYYHRKEELLFMSLYMHDFDHQGMRYPEEIQKTIRYFSSRYFRGATLFLISGGHMVFVAETVKNPKYKKLAQAMLDNFLKEYPKYRIDYKIIVALSVDEFSAQNDYVGLFRFTHNRQPQNSIRHLEKKDIDFYREHKYILQQMQDIQRKGNMEDERVEVYCQPVLNIRTGKFDTAETLMRLQLKDTGMVFPDRFIPIAEKHNCIHGLSLIIFSKTCRAIRSLMEEGYNIKRISVNFSMLDVREEDFCSSIQRIVQENNIPFDKVAIELTESQNEKDFMIVKEKISELKNSGVKFYLDDFGTGYSNFDRILELPFDIVKFDRSLVIASSADSRSETMVSHLANMFNAMNYSVLYEGVEDEADEERCKRMYAKYLQGYRYSRPIPLMELSQYLEKLG